MNNTCINTGVNRLYVKPTKSVDFCENPYFDAYITYNQYEMVFSGKQIACHIY